MAPAPKQPPLNEKMDSLMINFDQTMNKVDHLVDRAGVSFVKTDEVLDKASETFDSILAYALTFFTGRHRQEGSPTDEKQDSAAVDCDETSATSKKSGQVAANEDQAGENKEDEVETSESDNSETEKQMEKEEEVPTSEENRELAKEVASLNRQLNLTTGQLRHLEQQNHNLERNYSLLGNEMSQLRARLGSYKENTSATIEKEVAALKEQLDDKTDQIHDLQQENKNASQNLDNLKQEFVHLEETQFYCTTARNAEDCLSILQADGSAKDGVYTVCPYGSSPAGIKVYCDMQSGGYTVIQNRFDGSVGFSRDWNDYLKGFGSLEGEHWLGLESIHILTAANTVQLKIRLEDWDGTVKYADYGSFQVGPGTEYRIHYGSFSGSAGDSFVGSSSSNTALNMPFSSKDYDRDSNGGNCAVGNGGGGGWWYKTCSQSSLNGGDYRSQTHYGIFWYRFKNTNTSLRRSKMMIKRK